MVEPRLGRGGRLPAVLVHFGGDAGATAVRQTERRDMSLRRWSVTLLAALVALVTIAPLLWMVSVSFMARGEAAQFPPPLWPASPTLENYRLLFGSFGVGRFLLNSILVSTLATGRSEEHTSELQSLMR